MRRLKQWPTSRKFGCTTQKGPNKYVNGQTNSQNWAKFSPKRLNFFRQVFFFPFPLRRRFETNMVKIKMI